MRSGTPRKKLIPHPGLKGRNNKAQVGNPGGPEDRAGWRPGLLGPHQVGGLKVRKNTRIQACGILAPFQDAGFLMTKTPGLRS